MAQALGIDFDEAGLARMVAPLVALEPVFQKIAGTLTPDAEPATIFDPAPEDPAE